MMKQRKDSEPAELLAWKTFWLSAPPDQPVAVPQGTQVTTALSTTVRAESQLAPCPALR